MRVILEGNNTIKKLSLIKRLKDNYSLHDFDQPYTSDKFNLFKEKLANDNIIFTRFLITDLVLCDLLKKVTLSPVDAQILLNKAHEFGYKIFTVVEGNQIHNSVGRDINNSYIDWSNKLHVPILSFNNLDENNLEHIEEAIIK